MGALSTTWDEHYRTPFAPLLEGVTFVSFRSVRARGCSLRKTAAIIVEPLQGEGGVRPLRPEMAAAIKAACEKSGALLADEVQCGLGRTGVPFYLDPRPAARPGGGRQGAGRRGSGGRGADFRAGRGDDRVRRSRTTYGGNLLACRAALVFLDELTSGLLDHVAAIGPQIEAALRRVAARHACVKEVRGAGVIWGLELDRPAAPVVGRARARAVDQPPADTVLRLLPPAIVDQAAVDQMAVVLDAALTAARGEKG